jgi:hypothetical protein
MVVAQENSRTPKKLHLHEKLGRMAYLTQQAVTLGLPYLPVPSNQ